MKITIVFCALATITTAVPTYLRSHEDQTPITGHVADNLKREKKSLLRDAVSTMSPEAEALDKSASDNTNMGPKTSSMEGRSLGIQKPIIIKKKIGYHLYRDSDEEMAHADPHENCRKQVKVKLCDDGSKNMLNCFTSERFNEHISDKDIEHSIKTAKEAVENLQRGLQKMEHTSGKMIADKDLETDLEVHENIEAARVALEHVQQNFGKIETLKLSDNSQRLKESPLVKATDEERLSHWKEAIDNAQKKTEIGKNMEDAFKSESLHEKFLTNNEFPERKESEDLNANGKLLMSDHKEEHKSFESETLENNAGLLNKQREEVDSDMFTSPTETKHKLHSDSLISETFPKERDQDSESSNVQKATDHTSSMKDSQATHEDELENKEKVTCNDAHDHEHKEKAATDLSLSPEKHNEQEKFTDLETENSNILEPSTTSMMEHKDTGFSMKEKSSQTAAFNDISAFHSYSKDKSTSNSELATFDISQKFSNLEDGQISDELQKSRSSLENQQTFEKLMNKQKDNQDPHEHGNHPQNTNENFLKNAINTKVNEENIQEPTIHQNMKMANEHNMQPELTETSNLHNQWFMRLAENKHNDDINLQQFDDEPSDAHVPPSKTIDFPSRSHNWNKQESMRTSQNNGHRELQNPSLMGLMQEQHLSQDFLTDLRNAHSQNVKGTDLNEHQLFKDNTYMRLGQDHNTVHQLGEMHELHDPLTMQWAQTKQRDENFPHLAAASRFNEAHHHDQHIFEEMNEKQRQNMWSHAKDNSDLMMRLVQEKELRDQSKLSSELHNDHMHEVLTQNRFPNNFELTDMHEFPQQFQTSHGHFNIMKHAHTPDMDSAMQPSMIMSMRDSNGNPGLDHNDMNWSHHHHSMARYGSSLPPPIMNPGAVGVFPNANTGCGIPLMLSCSPSVVSGSLAKAHPAIAPPAYRSGDDLMFYMKRDAHNVNEIQFPNNQKTTSHNQLHKSNVIVKSQ